MPGSRRGRSAFMGNSVRGRLRVFLKSSLSMAPGIVVYRWRPVIWPESGRTEFSTLPIIVKDGGLVLRCPNAVDLSGSQRHEPAAAGSPAGDGAGARIARRESLEPPCPRPRGPHRPRDRARA